ncbi:MAG: glycosyltransferase [Micropruina sp.]
MWLCGQEGPGSALTGLLVHEWLARRGGSENVVHAFADSFPDADLWVLWNDDSDRFPRARESWIARTPLRRNRVAALPLMPFTWRHLPAPADYEWILASSHLFAHHARIANQPGLRRLAYVHTPARYIWAPEIDGRGDGALARLGAALLRSLDRKRAGDLDAVAANSQYIRERIHDAWGVDAKVIYPPVDVGRIRETEDWANCVRGSEQHVLDEVGDGYLLGASRFVSYKRLDTVIELGARLGRRVVLAGSGPEHKRLIECAEASTASVKFVLAPSDALLFALYQRAYAYVFPPVEDFGIMPVEAMACGTPVIVNSVGGARESVEICGGGHAVVMDSQSDLAEAAAVVDRLDRSKIRQLTEKFSRERFISEIREWVLGTGNASVGARTAAYDAGPA